jgi:uncharacterized protein
VSPARALLLTPGAGSGRDHRTLVALEKALKPIPVARVDFPYRKEGRKAPDRAPKLIATVVEEAARLAKRARVDPAAVALGGRSMGGRMCSMAVAEGLPSAGLVLLSYPLHPPGRPEKARVEHLPQIDVPVLFVSGTRDAFGTPGELEEAAARVAGPVTFHWLDGAGHDPKGADGEIAEVVGQWLDKL